MRSVPPRFASEPPALAGPALEAELANAAPTSRLAPITVAASAGRSFFCIGLVPFGRGPPAAAVSLQGIRRSNRSLVRVN